MTWSHYWRVRTRLPERFGQPCRVLARGSLNTILIEFEDGSRVATSRNYVRRLVPSVSAIAVKQGVSTSPTAKSWSIAHRRQFEIDPSHQKLDSYRNR